MYRGLSLQCFDDGHVVSYHAHHENKTKKKVGADNGTSQINRTFMDILDLH